MPKIVARVELKSLTSLRFFAAALIVFLHVSISSLCAQHSPVDLSGLKQGVSFFFVLSGFILRYAYPELLRWQDSVNFITARISRIWPSHLMAVVAFCAFSSVWLLPVRNSFPWITIVNVFMLQSLWQKSTVYYSLNAPSWSISTEFIFYLCFVPLIQNFSKSWKAKLAASGALSALVIGLCSMAWSNGYKVNDPDFYLGLVYICPLVRLFEFVLGMVTAELFLNKRWSISPERIWIFEFLCLIAIAGELIGLPQIFNAVGAPVTHPCNEWLSGSAGAPLFAALIFLFAHEKGHIGKTLALKPLVFLGEISFSIYLFHWILLQQFSQHTKLLPPPLTIPVYCLLLLVISTCNFRLVEIPARKHLRRIFAISYETASR